LSDLTSHRVPLEGTTWSVWRDVGLRGAGFPADKLLAICDESLATYADRAESDAGRLAKEKAYADAVGRLPSTIAGILADPGFQEALTWQNPGFSQILHDAGPVLVRRSKDRTREQVIASYLQRYCLKNDTIGFFGPVGWASAGHEAPGLLVVPGEQLIARRTTYLEVWAIDKVAAEVARQGRVLGWLRPRRTRSVYLAGNVLHRAHRPPVTLTDAELRVLLACDGRRTISDVLASAGGLDARPLLTRLAGLGALRLDLEGPMDARPEVLLRGQLEQIADPAARAAALEPVERIVTARDEVAACAGDAARLRRALAGMAETFEEVTGSPATRRAGQHYAGRMVVYQDSVRDVQVELGTAVTGALATPLGLVLDSVRWLVNDIAARYRTVFGELLDDEIDRAGGAPVPLSRFLAVASPHLSFLPGRGLSEVTELAMAELQRRWQEVLGPLPSASRHQVSSAEIAAKVAGCFPAHPVAWSGARQHSPDVMIAAASPDEVERGNFLLVLGELHVAVNTLENRALVEQHPDPARLIAADQADHGGRRIVPIPAKDYPNVGSRGSPPSAVLGSGQVYWSGGIIEALEPDESSTVMPAAAMTVARRGEDLVVHVLPSGTELDLLEVIGEVIGGVAVNTFQPLAPAPHVPRITIDRLVISREQWAFQLADSSWAFADSEQERFYLAQCWRREHDLPERVFYRVPGEPKPVAADFRSIVLINLFAKHVRKAAAAGHSEYSVTEMLPDLDQLWLADRAGRRYCSELRFVAFDGLHQIASSVASPAEDVSHPGRQLGDLAGGQIEVDQPR
jgi:hypothetical protein